MPIRSPATCLLVKQLINVGFDVEAAAKYHDGG
jgi:hypothetical protein